MPLDPAELRRLREDLRCEDADTRTRAIARLGEVLDSGTREIVAEALASDNPEVRAAAERLMERIGVLSYSAFDPSDTTRKRD
jgi:HEAT repeat protein